MKDEERNLDQLISELADVRKSVEELKAAEARRVQLDQALKISHARYQDFYDYAPDMFISVDAATGKIIQCNLTLSSATGYKREELIGRNSFDLYHPDCLEAAKKTFQCFVQTGEVRDAELQLKRKDGSKFDVSLNLTAVRDAHGNVLYSRSVWRDITARKQAEDLLAEQAIRDTLTGLYNRRYFNRRMQEEMIRADHNKYCLAVLLCDLDHFKAINDTEGHQSGDEVLKEVAKVAQGATRGSDLVFRWGGDEIVVVLSGTTPEGVRIAAERIRRGIQRIRVKNNRELDISIGVAFYPEHSRTIDELLNLADRALYIAKKGGEKIHIAGEDYQVDEHSAILKKLFDPSV